MRISIKLSLSLCLFLSLSKKRWSPFVLCCGEIFSIMGVNTTFVALMNAGKIMIRIERVGTRSSRNFSIVVVTLTDLMS